MNDIEKAKNQLIDLKIWLDDNKEHEGESIEAIDVALHALEKQTAKKPLLEDNGGYSEYYEIWLECPVCGEAIPEYTAENNTWCFCLGCGQKLVWSEVENE